MDCKPRPCVTSKTRWAGILLGSAALLTSSLPLPAGAQDTRVVRDAGIRMMGASLFVPGIAAYCDESVASNKPLLKAAGDWNVRNKRLMEQTVAALHLSGALSREEKDLLDRVAYKLVKETVERESNRMQFCTNVTNVVDSGALDLDQRKDLAGARAMIRATPGHYTEHPYQVGDCLAMLMGDPEDQESKELAVTVRINKIGGKDYFVNMWNKVRNRWEYEEKTILIQSTFFRYQRQACPQSD